MTLERRKPLGRGKPLNRGSKPMSRGKPLAHNGPWPSRSKPIKAKRDAPRRRNRDDVDHGLPWPEVRLVIYARSLGRCEACGTQLNIANMEGHHRRTRKVGPDCPCNALALCSTCHHAEVHAQPEAAMEAGRILSRHGDELPSEQPVEVHGQGVVLLTCGGTYVAAA